VIVTFIPLTPHPPKEEEEEENCLRGTEAIIGLTTIRGSLGGRYTRMGGKG